MATNFRGYTLTPSSYQDDDMRGWWFPLVIVSGEKLISDIKVALEPQKGINQIQADQAAMQTAMQRIVNNNL